MDSSFKPIENLCCYFFMISIGKYFEENVHHIDMVFKLLEEKHLYTNPYECAFVVKDVEYLGQFVAHEGFEVDANKIQFMLEWIVLKNLKNIR